MGPPAVKKNALETSSLIAALLGWLLLSALNVFILWALRDRARLVRDHDNERTLNILWSEMRNYDDFGSAVESDPVLKERIIGLAMEKNNPDFQWKNLFRHAKQELMLRSDYTFQKKAGYQNATEEERAAKPNHYYLGEPYSLSFRYGYQYRDVQWGITGEKDAGEAFWNKNHKGFDYYAFNLNVKNKGILENLHLGDYRLSFGQGLVMNTNFSMGKTAMVSNINQKNTGIRRHVSTGENGFFRGVAGTLKYKDLRLHLFYSDRKQDATADSSFIYTFKTDGYHRLPNDLNKKQTAHVTMKGAHVQWRNESFHAGWTSVYYSFEGKELNPEIKPYNLFYLRGKNHFNTGINYGYNDKKISFQGESARNASGKWATINNLLIHPSPSLHWIFSYRNYARDYNALYGNAFAESSTVRNEKGFYTGFQFRPFRKWEIAAYADFFQFPWLKYGVNAPYTGTETFVQLAYKLDARFQMDLRYKYKEKAKNEIGESGRETSVLPYEQQRWRYRFHYRNEKGLALKTQADYNRYATQTGAQTAWALTQTFAWAKDKSNFQFDGAFAYFHTGDWNTRISIYEKNILYAFSFPNYYGEGLRFYSVIKWKITPSLTFYCKWASTRYFDRETIGSGLEEIKGKDKTDFYGLVRYCF